MASNSSDNLIGGVTCASTEKCRLVPRPANLYARAVRRGKRLLHVMSAMACLLAIFVSAGGHWAVLQSVAYTRMVIEFAEHDSLRVAVKKAFDERYACSLCPKIRDGFNKEQKIPSGLGEMYQPEFLLQSNALVFFRPVIVADVVLSSTQHPDFSDVPPKPPPRAA